MGPKFHVKTANGGIFQPWENGLGVRASSVEELQKRIQTMQRDLKDFWESCHSTTKWLAGFLNHQQ